MMVMFRHRSILHCSTLKDDERLDDPFSLLAIRRKARPRWSKGKRSIAANPSSWQIIASMLPASALPQSNEGPFAIAEPMHIQQPNVGGTIALDIALNERAGIGIPLMMESLGV
jgi:hypothetical protein